MGERLTATNKLPLLQIKTPHSEFEISHLRAKNKLSISIGGKSFKPTVQELDEIIDTLLTFYERRNEEIK